VEFFLSDWKNNRPNQWYFAWGIRVPVASEWFLDAESLLPDVTHAFVNLCSDGTLLPLSTLEPADIPLEWHCVENNKVMIVAKPIHEFPHDAESFTAAFGDWIATKIEAALPVLDKLVPAIQ
jgi:hypothetical protein